jgi:hypothetical protein
MSSGTDWARSIADRFVAGCDKDEGAVRLTGAEMGWTEETFVGL